MMWFGGPTFVASGRPPPTVTRTVNATPSPTRTQAGTPVTPTATPTTVIASGQVWRFYYYAGSARIAVREKAAGVNNLYFLLSDHLGGASKTISATGEIMAELRYTAFGETWYGNGNTPTELRYTGQREFGELGLYFYQSRFYDAMAGRFVSADTIVPNPGNPLAWDRYSYVQNNAIKYSDPTGHKACDNEINGQCITDPTGRWQLPTVEQVPNPEKRDLDKFHKSITNYSRLRDALYDQYGRKAVTTKGKIKDKYFIALIIIGEFGTTKNMEDAQDLYYESLEAVSNQYDDKFEDGSSTNNNIFCDGSCSLIEQIAWVSDVQGFYSGASEENYKNHNNIYDSLLGDATKAMNGYVHGIDNSWMWGNVHKTDLEIVDGVTRWQGHLVTATGPSGYSGYDISIVWGWYPMNQ